MRKRAQSYNEFRSLCSPPFEIIAYRCFYCIFVLTMAIGVAAFLVWAFWPYLAGTLSSNGDGESLEVLSGISIWPSIALRICTFLLSLWLIFFDWTKLWEISFYCPSKVVELLGPLCRDYGIS
jgi:hypothetical protein